jgi:sodium transport system permease protein
MSRFSRISTIWWKELTDTLRDRRTLTAMVLVPIVLYPALMLGSLQAFELQTAAIQQTDFTIGVASEAVRDWLRARIDTDISRFEQAADVPAEELPDLQDDLRASDEPPPSDTVHATERAAEEASVRERPPAFEIVVVPDVADAMLAGTIDVGIVIEGPLPTYVSEGTSQITIVYDQTEFRSYRFAAPGIEGVLTRLREAMVLHRLKQADLDPNVLNPIDQTVFSVATPERVGGSVLGTIVPLILIIMTISGAIYPAIDLTAGERERGTLETLMVAPVPKVDLITGKFLVVAFIGLLTAALNLLSVGGTIYLGGLGSLLTGGDNVEFPMGAIPVVLLLLVPLSVLFAALLLAVCSFARSFKEAQNYVMPVMVAALIPAVVGTLPGTRLEGPLLVMPVTNIVVLTKDLFLGKFELINIIITMLSTTLYAAAAVAVAARLFGQEAVLFADSGSFKTLLVRKFYKPSRMPSASTALLMVAVIYLANFYIQSSVLAGDWFQAAPERYLGGVIGVLWMLLFLVPIAVCVYAKVRVPTALQLGRPTVTSFFAAICLGASTWVLAIAWSRVQQMFLPIDPNVAGEFVRLEQFIFGAPLPLLLLAFAVTPAIVEEVFFRGFALSGLRSTLGAIGAVLVTSLAFAMFHQSVHRLLITFALGVVLGLLAVRSGAIWPAMIAHLMHNGMSVLAVQDSAVARTVQGWGFPTPNELGAGVGIPTLWLVGAAALTGLGIVLACLSRPVASLADDGAHASAPQPALAR